MIEVTEDGGGRRKKKKKRKIIRQQHYFYTIPEDAPWKYGPNLLDSIEFYTNILLSPAQTGNCDMNVYGVPMCVITLSTGRCGDLPSLDEFANLSDVALGPYY